MQKCEIFFLFHAERFMENQLGGIEQICCVGNVVKVLFNTEGNKGGCNY